MKKLEPLSRNGLRALVLDIDGVLTDGTVDLAGGEKKVFLRDIDAINVARRNGFQIAFLTGEEEPLAKDIVERCGGGPAVFGAKDKAAGIRRLAEIMTVGLSEICYVGDSDRDAPAMELVCLAVAPRDGSSRARSAADCVTRSRGGQGAVEETIAQLLHGSSVGRAEIKPGLLDELREITRLLVAFGEDKHDELCDIIGNVIGCLQRNGKVVFFGNGGSAAIAQHAAAEFVGRFSRSRRPLPAVSLTADTAVITAIANDFGFEQIFERQVNATVQFGDTVIGMSTSGKSENVARGLAAARKQGATSIAFVGAEPGIIGVEADFCITFPSRDSARIQELHLIALHLMCRQVDALMSHSLVGTPKAL